MKFIGEVSGNKLFVNGLEIELHQYGESGVLCDVKGFDYDLTLEDAVEMCLSKGKEQL